MPRLVDEAFDAIGDNDPEVVANGIRLASSFFECSHGQTQGLERAAVLAEPASPADLARLRGRLVDLVRARPLAPVTTAAVFTLGKLHDPSLTPFFIELLRNYLHADAGVLYQAMIALDNLGVGVFAGRDSMSLLAEDENRALAADFLRQHEGQGEPNAAADRPRD
jgi:HEAT repeat protein